MVELGKIFHLYVRGILEYGLEVNWMDMLIMAVAMKAVLMIHIR